MPIKISATLKSAIAAENKISKEEIEDHLRNKSAGRCHLCDAEFNYASDDIEVDHDIPVDASGNNLLHNLHLSHAECNRFKKAQGSRDVRSLLRFKRFYTNQKGGSLDYAGALEFFEVSPQLSSLEEVKGNNVVFHFPNQSKQTAAVFKSRHRDKDYEFCFVYAPIEAIFNDNECQPRLIKLNHAFAISVDLASNPLHEPPACRINRLDDSRVQLMLFDGQHKALASWLRNEKGLVVKVYLNMTRGEATGLVNAIQSKIKKLPLTPFELAAKLSDEYRDRLAIYEEKVGAEECSEEGFIGSLPAAERVKAKKEIESAVLRDIADDPSLVLANIVEMRGRKVEKAWKITEIAFQTKLLKTLAHTTPLPSRFKGSEMQAARFRERQNIIHYLNVLYEKVFDLDENSSENERERARRMAYQGALKYVASLLRKIVINRMTPTNDDFLFLESPSEAQSMFILEAIERLVNHFVWTASFDSQPMKAVQDALSKNQNIENAIENAGLTPAYCVNL